MVKMILKIYQQILRMYVYTFRIKETKILHESGSSKKVGSILKRDGFNNVLIITDNTIKKLGLLSNMIESIKKEKIKYTIYSEVVPNPLIKNVEDAKQIYLDKKCEAIIAFGGGSVIDCAKIVGVVALTGKKVQRYDHMIPLIPKMTRLYTVPTTAGTGSEVTISAVISDEKNHKKMSITDKMLAPDYAILDPELMVGLPKEITAATGIDALTHAVEAYVGNWKFKVTDAYAVKAVKKILDNLENAYKDGKDINARSEMAIGATYGGYAFRTAGVGYVHAIAHRLSELYRVPHGLANAIVLPHVLRYSFDKIYIKLADLCEKIGIAEKVKSKKEVAMSFIERIEKLNENLAIPKFVEQIKDKHIDMIAKRAINEANSTYPVPYIMNRKEMERFIRTIMK
jgi:alcohol dehydrogenase